MACSLSTYNPPWAIQELKNELREECNKTPHEILSSFEDNMNYICEMWPSVRGEHIPYLETHKFRSYVVKHFCDTRFFKRDICLFFRYAALPRGTICAILHYKYITPILLLMHLVSFLKSWSVIIYFKKIFCSIAIVQKLAIFQEQVSRMYIKRKEVQFVNIIINIFWKKK